MQIPNNIEKEHLLKAIEKIDNEGYDHHAESSYYDVVHNSKRYPPKLVVSWANIFANGEELDRKQFEGGINTPAFKLLEKHGLEIVKKNADKLIDKIKLFSEAYKEEVQQPHYSDLTSFQLLVKDIPEHLRKKFKILMNTLKIKGSIGAGVNTYYPWIGIFDPLVSSGATNGFYVVILFSDDFQDFYLTLNQGSTIQSKEQTEGYRNYVYSLYNKVDGFVKGRIPEGGLVKTKEGKASSNGRKYEETNIFYRKYEIETTTEEDLVENLEIIVAVYIDCANKYFANQTMTKPFPTSTISKPFSFEQFHSEASSAGLQLNEGTIIRFISSLLTKPFVILTGLSGSGKTKLAQAFAMWICENENQYCIVPVGADWINREPLLGFPNSLDDTKYVKPDNGVLDLIMEASKQENQTKPYFLILDEMNLSHVERYFADFLSVMESQDKKGILLHSDNSRKDSKNVDILNSIKLPANLFIVGTVNIDETTYMFSPKVLDRANVIEFRVTHNEMNDFFEANEVIRLDTLKAQGATMASSFISLATDKDLQLDTEMKKEITGTLLKFFDELKKLGAEFGYRSASEILRFGAIVGSLETGWEAKQIIDSAIMQKLLPKLHGSRSKLVDILIALGKLCVMANFDVKKEVFEKHNEFKFEDEHDNVLYPISLEKLSRMHKNVVEHGFTSYAEA